MVHLTGRCFVQSPASPSELNQLSWTSFSWVWKVLQFWTSWSGVSADKQRNQLIGVFWSHDQGVHGQVTPEIQFNIAASLTPLWNQNVDFPVLRVSSPSDGAELLSLDLRFWFSCVGPGASVVRSLLYVPSGRSLGRNPLSSVVSCSAYQLILPPSGSEPFLVKRLPDPRRRGSVALLSAVRIAWPGVFQDECVSDLLLFLFLRWRSVFTPTAPVHQRTDWPPCSSTPPLRSSWQPASTSPSPSFRYSRS